MRGYTTSEKIRYWLFSDGIPVSKLVIITNIITFLAIALFQMKFVVAYLGFYSPAATAMPWTLFTYPLIGAYGGAWLLSLLFSAYWMWIAGGAVERSWGSRTFGFFFVGVSAISALGLYAGGFITGHAVSSAGLWLPLAAVTVAFGMLNPEQTILFMLFIPMKLKYLAMISAAALFISYGMQNLLLGVFALAGCATAYWYVRYGRELDFRPVRGYRRDNVIRINPDHIPRRKGLSPLAWYKDYRDRKKLKDLFRKSGFGD